VRGVPSRYMPKVSIEELRAQVAAGGYAIDSHELAGAILTKFAMVRRVGRRLISEDEEPAADAGPGRSGAGRRRARSASAQRSRAG
jgi:hypothetical protein